MPDVVDTHRGQTISRDDVGRRPTEGPSKAFVFFVLAHRIDITKILVVPVGRRCGSEWVPGHWSCLPSWGVHQNASSIDFN